MNDKNLASTQSGFLNIKQWLHHHKHLTIAIKENLLNAYEKILSSSDTKENGIKELVQYFVLNSGIF